MWWSPSLPQSAGTRCRRCWSRLNPSTDRPSEFLVDPIKSLVRCLETMLYELRYKWLRMPPCPWIRSSKLANECWSSPAQEVSLSLRSRVLTRGETAIPSGSPDASLPTGDSLAQSEASVTTVTCTFATRARTLQLRHVIGLGCLQRRISLDHRLLSKTSTSIALQFWSNYVLLAKSCIAHPVRPRHLCRDRQRSVPASFERNRLCATELKRSSTKLG